DRKILHDERHNQREDHAIHAVETPTSAVRNGDVPVRLRHCLARPGDGSIIRVLQVLLFKRPGAAHSGSSDAYIGIDRRGAYRSLPRCAALKATLVHCRCLPDATTATPPRTGP